jgi:hypothetical protein
MDLGIRLRARKIGMDFSEHELGNRQAEGAADFSGHELCDQRTWPLAGAPKLQDVEPIVIRFDDRRQGTTLSERRHVTRDPDCTEQLHVLILARLRSRSSGGEESGNDPKSRAARGYGCGTLPDTCRPVKYPSVPGPIHSATPPDESPSLRSVTTRDG